MIIVSDNTATNMLIDRAGGVDAINRTMRDLGFTATTVNSRIDFDLIGDDGRRLAVASPRDLARMGELLVRGDLISPEASAGMLAILGRQHYLNQVPRYYDYNPYGPELGVPQSIWIGCKTGALPGMRADAGVVRLPGDVAFAYAVMNEGSRDTGFTNENESEIVNGAVGRLLLEHWWPAESGTPLPAVDSPYLSTLLGDR
jgi:beta-lactamase class A